MKKIHSKILVSLFSLLVIPTVFYFFGLIWRYFQLGRFTTENLFVERSNCDPAEAEPTYFTFFIVLIIGILFSNYFVKLLAKYSII